MIPCFGVLIGGTVVALGPLYAAIVLSAGIGALSLWWMNTLVPILSIKRLTVPAAFYWMYFLRVYLPAHVILLENRGPSQWTYMIGVDSTLLLIPLGMTAAQIVLRRGRRASLRFFAAHTWPPMRSKTTRLWIYGLGIVSLAVVAIHVSLLPSIPIISLLQNPGQSSLIAAMREDSFKMLAVPGGLKYLMSWTQSVFLPLLVLLCLTEYRITRKGRWLVLLAGSFALEMFYSSLTLAKGPVAGFLLILVLFYWLWFDVKLTPRRLILAFGLVLAFPFLVNFVSYGKQMAVGDILTTINGLARRLLYVTADMPYHYFDLFPLRGEFLGGRTIGLLSSLMGWEYFNTSRFVYSIIVPGGLQTGYANSVFIGDLYADFGMQGVLVGSFLVGGLLQTLQAILERYPRNSLLLGVYVIVCVNVMDLVSMSLTISLMTGGLILALVLLFADRCLHSLLISRPTGPS
jgi:hypothetical protein